MIKDKSLKPPIDWQNQKCAEFSQLRKRTRTERTKFLSKYPIEKFDALVSLKFFVF